MDGTEALRQIREQLVAREPLIAQLKFVAISASVLRHEQEEFTRSGFAQFICKPFRLEEIWSCLENLLKVEFDYETPATETGTDGQPDFARLQAPNELLERLRGSAELYSTTEVREYLGELETLNPDGKAALAHLHELNEAGAIDEFLNALGKVRIS